MSLEDVVNVENLETERQSTFCFEKHRDFSDKAVEMHWLSPRHPPSALPLSALLLFEAQLNAADGTGRICTQRSNDTMQHVCIY